MCLQSLVDLAAGKAINDHQSLQQSLETLPRAILNSLLVASIRRDRVLTLRVLITQWPLKQLVLRDCPGFIDSHAVLFAYLLQKSRQILEVVDIRGCKIGLAGTTAFCKVALGFPVSQNDFTNMTVIDSHALTPWDECAITPSTNVPPLTVLLDCHVTSENVEMAKQALIHHSIVNLKVCQLTLVELGRVKVCSLASLLEPDIITILDCQMNSLEQEGIMALVKTLATFRNLEELNLAYNRIMHRDRTAVSQLAAAFSHLPKLKRLDLTENIIGSETCTILKSIVSPLTHLYLNGCGIRDAELLAMSNLDVLHHLEHLELSTNALVYCLKSMSKFVWKSSGTLKYLAVEDNMFVSSSVPLLCRMTKKLNVLKTLSLCYNHLTHDDVQAVREAIPDVEVLNRDWLF